MIELLVMVIRAVGVAVGVGMLCGIVLGVGCMAAGIGIRVGEFIERKLAERWGL